MLGSEAVFDPSGLLAMWAAGIFGTGAFAVGRRIAGPGFSLLTVGTASLIGAGAWLFDPGLTTVAAVLIGLAAGLVVRRPHAAALIMVVSAVSFLLVAARGSASVAVLTGSAALGAVTSGMLLGHWYLIDPRIPRRPLQGLAALGAAAVALDAIVVLALNLPLAGGGFLAAVAPTLAGVSCALLVAVWFALGYPSYSGVMAATGLGYLAILTCLGSITTARVLAEGAPTLG